METNTKKEKKTRKPSFFLYEIIAGIGILLTKLYWRVKVDRKEIKNIKGPTLAIAPHASTIDPVPVFAALWPKRYNIIAGKDLFTWKELKPFIKAFGAIPMTQGGMDLQSVKTMKKAVDDGRSLLLFPEGKTTLDGKQLFYMNPSVAKLIKMFGRQVVLVKTNGAYCTKPRYIKGFRRGRMEVKASILFTEEEVRDLKPQEIFMRIQQEFKYNDNVWQIENKVKFKAKNLADHLNYILYKCPKCGEEYKHIVTKNAMRCLACGNEVEMTCYGELKAKEGSVSKDRIDLWVNYEREEIEKETEKEDFCLRHAVTAYERNDEKHEYVEIGKGTLFIDRETIGYEGKKNGEDWNVIQHLAHMPYLVTKNKEGIDLNEDGKTYRFMFDEKKYSMKYGLVAEVLFAKRNGLTF